MKATTAVVNLARAVAATAAILGIIGGVPVVLWLIGTQLLAQGWPVRLEWRSVGELLSRPDDGTILLSLLLVVATMAWALLTYSILAEFVAVLTRRQAPRIDLPGFRAGRAFATILVGALLGVGSTSAWAAPVIPPSIAAQQVPGHGDPTGGHGAGQQLSDAREYTVESGDTLWAVAERELGDPLRWREIVRLSADRVQHDGGRVTESGLLHVGWVLTLPADQCANGEARRSVTVKPGDTLSGIAARELDDPGRADDIFDLNRDRPQPDGGRLDSADLIQPGWILQLPGDPPTENDASQGPAQPPPAVPRPTQPAPRSSAPPPSAPPPPAPPSAPDGGAPAPSRAPAGAGVPTFTTTTAPPPASSTPPAA